MLSRKSSKLYKRIMASFLSMVLFVCCVQVFAIRYTALQNENAFRARVAESMDAVNERVSDSVFSLFDLSAMVCSNALVQENLRPYNELTAGQLYYYSAILSLLQQTRLQYIDLVDSLFLYADSARVLYCASEKGMAASDTFFTLLMRYQKYDQAYWEGLLQNAKSGYAVLSPDRYATNKVGDERTVIPVTYIASNLGVPNVLSINLSVDRLARLFIDRAAFPGTRCLIYRDGAPLLDAPEALPAAGSVQLDGIKYFASRVYQPMLKLDVITLTPVSAYLNLSGYFRLTMLSLLAAFAVFGLLLAVFMSRKVYKPFEIVSRDIRSIQDIQESASWYSDELQSIRGGISTLASDRDQYRHLNRQHSLHYAQQSFATLLDGGKVADEGYLLRLLREDHGFVTPVYQCADILLDTLGKDDYRTLQALMQALSARVERAFGEAGLACIRVHYQRNMLVLILNASDSGQARAEEVCRLLISEIAGNEAAPYSLRIGLGGAQEGLAGVYASFQQANSAVLAMPPEAANELSVLREAREEAAFEYDRRDVMSAVSRCNIQALEEAVEETLSAVKKARVSYPVAAGIVRDIYHTALSAQMKMRPGQPWTPHQQEDIDPLAVLLLSPDTDASSLMNALLRTARYEAARPERVSEEIAVKAKAYIDAHYAQELSLDIIAEHLGVSAKYISRMFKASMGVNLSDYLAYVRVERIKELLPSGLSLEHIAQSVGITNRTTFIRTFRKVEGLTPGEYRALHQ